MRCVSHPCEAIPLGDPCLEPCVAEIEYTDADTCAPHPATSSLPPRTFSSGPPEEFWDLTLEEAIQQGSRRK